MTTAHPLAPAAISAAAQRAMAMIPPVWPLASSVAVNPFLGQAAETLPQAAARLARVGGVAVTMPRAWYLERIATGRIGEADLAAALQAALQAALAAAPQDAPSAIPSGVAALKAAAAAPRPAPAALPSVADLVARASGTDWPAILAERIGAWAGARLDEGQALWTAPRSDSAWADWRAWATRDLTPEIHGLRGFARFVTETPADPAEAIARAVARLGLEGEALEGYFHQLLFGLGGWAQYARHLSWKAGLAGASDATLADLLAIRLAWEEALFLQCPEVAKGWAATVAAHGAPLAPGAEDIVDAILQDAAERAAQRELADALAAPVASAGGGRPVLQAAFCIDVRSELFRRALETCDPGIRTLGFAGFFGVFARHRGFASDVDELRLPVLLNPTVQSRSAAATGDAEVTARAAHRATRAWGRFRLAAVSSFAFVEAMGPVYLGKLVKGALGLERMATPGGPAPRFDPALDPAARIEAAQTVLRAMSLTEGFARVVLLAGHGANVVNNPHASGLHCGACGGHSGEVNARLLAGLLNDAQVRDGLRARGIDVPGDTLFVAALHDTTTDAVTLYEGDAPLGDHAGDLARIRGWLAAAGQATRAERALRLPRADGGGDVAARSRDWAEVRPEWALAGCAAFIAAPRARTAGRTLGGRAFLHDYDWRADETNGFGVLELILTAPVVVASWISLQYYGSTVAPDAFGSGNKLLHNVVGGIGVLEGNGGPMRAGLAWQSVHDGADYIHDPLRLSVMMEAPVAAMNDILARHDGVRALFDNGWLHLFALDAGGVAQRYTGNLTWEPFSVAPEDLKDVA